MNALLIFSTALLGAFLASFLDVLADRLPKGEKPFGRSACVHCGRILRALDLVPIVSWLMVAGRCRTCGMRIPVRHLLGEGGLAFLFGYAAATLEDPFDYWTLGLQLFLLSLLFVVFFADFRFFIIPDEISWTLIGTGLLAVLSAYFFAVPWEEFVPSLKWGLLGGIFGALFLGAFSFVSKGSWMGWGDVKLAAGLGLWFGFPEILILLAFAFILGAAVGVLLLALKRKKGKDLLPFGPFIVLAALPFLFGYADSINYFFGVVEFIQ